jgi:hypothetical protein
MCDRATAYGQFASALTKVLGVRQFAAQPRKVGDRAPRGDQQTRVALILHWATWAK